MIEVRVMLDSDLGAVGALRRLSTEELSSRRGGDLLHATDSAVSEPVTFVGCIEGSVIGVATLSRTGSRATLTELFTHPGARGVGVGNAMLGAVQSQSRAWGCDSLDSYALPGDRDTKNFFEAHGMKARLLVVNTKLHVSEAT